MSRRNYAVKLDTARVKTNADLLFYISDMQSDRFTIKVTEKGQVLDLSNHVCAMIGISPSNKVAVQYITEQESNILTIVLQRHMMNEVGQWKGRIVIFNEEQTLVLDTFGYIVQQDELAQIDTNVQDDDRTPILTDLINQCRAIIEVEAARVITEQSRVNAEIQRVNQEQARVEAEQQRANEYKEIIYDLSGMRQEFDDFILQCQNSIDEAINRINSTDEQVKTNEQERQQAENIRQSNEEERINNELNRQQVEAKRVSAEQERSNNYAAMVEAEEERKQQAIQHHQAEQERVQAEELRVQAENQRHTVEQARVLNEEQRVQNEQVRQSNEVIREQQETQRQSNETNRQSNFNTLITEVETKVDTFDAYTVNAIAEEEQRVQNELARKQNEDTRVQNEDTRVQNENKRIAAENTRVSNEATRVQNETNRQNIFSAKVTEVDNKVNDVETRFNALTSKQQQDAEVIDARDGETSLKARLDRDIEKANKELDKIKKLEESTVSTVTTESDFTTVEATSNGYFEDVKLEGKTLVNLSTVKNGSFEFMTGSPSKGIDIPLLKTVSGKITLIVNLKSNTLDRNVKISLRTTTNEYIYSSGIPQGSLGNLVLSYNTVKNDIVCEITKLRIYTDNTTSGSVEIDNITILEGDHTQNPPSYFEGLKSVGQSTSGDTADEIVVSSNNNQPKQIETTDDNSITTTIDNPNYQSDKKRLLYYNNETQTWEKPILRQWDSIEKHADGKYYYHQRSREVVLNGSENIVVYKVHSDVISFNITIADTISNKSTDYFISDKINFNKYCYESNVEGIAFSPYVNRNIYFNISKSKLSTQDVQGFKKWLQANPVTVVYQLAQEKVYECTNIDLITYANETNYVVSSGAIVPRTTLKVLQNAANIIRQLQQKVSVLEQNESKFMQILIDLINK